MSESVGEAKDSKGFARLEHTTLRRVRGIFATNITVAPCGDSHGDGAHMQNAIFRGEHDWWTSIMCVWRDARPTRNT